MTKQINTEQNRNKKNNGIIKDKVNTLLQL